MNPARKFLIALLVAIVATVLVGRLPVVDDGAEMVADDLADAIRTAADKGRP